MQRGAWKPTTSGCLMEAGGRAFCRVCREALVLAIYRHVDPIEGCKPEPHELMAHKKALSGAVLTFGVKDIDAARASLESRKVRFDGPTQTIPGMVRLATFFDEDGNALMLYQDLAGAHRT